MEHDGEPLQQVQAVRTALAQLLLSAGTPMLAGGSEIYRTQYGNNNAYNLDTIANWLDWPVATMQSALTDFTRNLTLFRRAHPCLRPVRFSTGIDHNANGLKDLTWYFDSGAEVRQDYFANPDNHFLAYRIDGTEFADAAISIYVGYNGWSGPITVTIPAPLAWNVWYIVADTSSSAEPWGNTHPAGTSVALMTPTYLVNGRSVVVLLERWSDLAKRCTREHMSST